MSVEIEHKYLVKSGLWKQITPEQSVEVKQAYLSTDPNRTIRVRTIGSKAFITIKGKSIGASRPEYEYEIPVVDALQLIENFSSHLVEKTRHYIKVDGKAWEVDEFKGLNAGLFVAEIELENDNEQYTLPLWADTEVTTDPKYANSNLALRPFSAW